MLATESHGRVTVIRLTDGKLNAANAGTFRLATAKLVEDGATRLVVDLARVSFVDSSGLGALVGLLKRVGNAGDLAVADLQPAVRRMFELTRMDRVFRVFPDAASGVAALSG